MRLRALRDYRMFNLDVSFKELSKDFIAAMNTSLRSVPLLPLYDDSMERLSYNCGLSSLPQIDQDNITQYVWATAQETAILKSKAVYVFANLSDFYENEFKYCSVEFADSNYYQYSYEQYFIFEGDLLTLIESDEECWDESTTDTYYLGEYHERNIDTVTYFTEKNKLETRPALGVELEVYADDRMETLVNLRDRYEPEDLILESDTSLNQDHGFEIVTQPYGLEEWQLFAPDLLGILEDADVVTSKDGYGIHVNIHRRHFTPLAEARIFMLLCAEENADFVRYVAQRRNVYNATRPIGTTPKCDQKVKTLGGLDRTKKEFKGAKGKCKGKKIKGCGKYAPLNLKENIAEFRIFQATTNKLEFFKNLEFIWALQKWTSLESLTGSSWQYQDFLRWLHPNRDDFPNLVKFLDLAAISKSYEFKV